MAQANSIPITPYKLVNGVNAAIAPIMSVAEKATQTFLIGTPVLVAGGVVEEAPTINDATDQLAGFATQFAHDLATAGVGVPLTYGSVQNQPSAKNIPMGAPLSDGQMGFYVANDQVWFKAKTDSAHTLAQADIGAIYGLTKDGTCNYWYVDTTITAVNSGACVRVTELIDPIGTVGGLVAFEVMAVRQQFASS